MISTFVGIIIKEKKASRKTTKLSNSFDPNTKHFEGPGLAVLKLKSCSTHLSTKFQLLIQTKVPTNEEVFALSLSDVVFIMLINVKMPTSVGILTFMRRIHFLQG